MVTAQAIAGRIRESLPGLNLQINERDANVDWSIDIPRQDGVLWACHLNRQGDALHFSVGSFSLAWFPIDRQEIREAYCDAVIGFLSGRYRVIESIRWGHGVGGELQVPDGPAWKTVGNASSGMVPRSWLSTTRVLQNAQHMDAADSATACD